MNRTHFYEVLWFESGRRNKFPGEEIDIDGTLVPRWVKHERSILLKEVNEIRAENNLEPVTEQDIKCGEVVGDPEYGGSLAEHCAKLCH